MNSEHNELIERLRRLADMYAPPTVSKTMHSAADVIQALTSKPAEVGVPVIPTDEMVNAGCMALQGSIGGYEAGQIYTAWKAMLLAAPTKPDSEDVEANWRREEFGSEPSQPVGNAGEVAVLERYGRAGAEAPVLFLPMPDGYWTPWHIAQAALDAATAPADEVGGEAVEWQRRQDSAFNGEWGEWESITRDQFDHLARIIGNRSHARIAATSYDDLTPAERPDGWPTQIRALYTAQPSQEDARDLPERKLPDDGNGDDDAYNRGWNECRAAMAASGVKADG